MANLASAALKAVKPATIMVTAYSVTTLTSKHPTESALSVASLVSDATARMFVSHVFLATRCFPKAKENVLSDVLTLVKNALWTMFAHPANHNTSSRMRDAMHALIDASTVKWSSYQIGLYATFVKNLTS